MKTKTLNKNKSTNNKVKKQMVDNNSKEEVQTIPETPEEKPCLTCGKLSIGEVCSVKCQNRYMKQAKRNTRKLQKLRKEEKLVKVTIDGKEYEYPKTMIFDFQPKEYKINENKKKVQEGEIAVLYLRESGLAELKYIKPENGMYIVNGRYYHVVGSCNYNLGKKRTPLTVIPEWSFIPLSREDYEISLGSQYQEAQSLIIKSLENAEIVKINQDLQPKKAPNAKLIIFIIIGAIIALFVLNKYFGGG